MSVTLTLTTEEDVIDAKPVTLMEKWRHAYKTRRAKKSVWLPRVFLFGLTVTLLYSLLVYLIPFYYKDSGDGTIYQLKVLACFLCANALANLFSVICYDTSIKKSRDRPGLPKHVWESPPDKFVPHIQNLFQSKDSSETDSRLDNVNLRTPGINVKKSDVSDVTYGRSTDGLPWRFCGECEVELPPRAVHCKTCNKCILKRDHHCYMTAVCIGHYNQRYFMMLCFYGLVYCGWGVYLTNAYVKEHFWSNVSWLDFFPPWSIVKTITGSMSAKEFMMTHHLLWLLIFAVAGCFYSAGQFMLVTLNKTLYEFTKVDPYRSTTSIFRNFRSVFGDFWMLNFIFPTQILYRQIDDGYHWEGLKLRKAPIINQFKNWSTDDKK